ncbi:MAG: SpoIID/LytB domain-containing protein [Calditrichaeota bacterium]|nr:SpoIID/LytB domain-containing protein [Calditrichota bacterium]
MLEAGAIPESEPTINVGIILPEDEFTSLSIRLPKSEDYQIEFSGQSFLLEPETEIFFKLSGKEINFRIGDQEFKAPGEIRLFPVFPSNRLVPGQGVLVKNVITGRSFHWRKYINVTLPETLVLRRIEKQLILINELPIEKYLMCVATSEMGAECPIALLEAQTIAARSWLLANVEQKHRSLGMDVCNDDCCQRYQGTTFLSELSVQATVNSRGLVLLYQDKICDARYSKSCGGVMESFDTIWGGKPLPYTKIKADAEKDPPEWHKPLSNEKNIEKWLDSSPNTFCSPHVVPESDLKKYLGSVDEEGRYFRWTIRVPQKALVQNINRYCGVNAKAVKQITVKSRGGSGRANRIEIVYLDDQNRQKTFLLKSEYDIRRALHPSFLYSSAIIIKTIPAEAEIPDEFIYLGAGWGHGVGLCQIGALGMSLKGYTSDEIVFHYYPGSILKRIY